MMAPAFGCGGLPGRQALATARDRGYLPWRKTVSPHRDICHYSNHISELEPRYGIEP